mmetsp:Transcript_5251/g.10807  ORF Transcript_5251/g.10807 Transcript_5251/m.10807 type:complete len:270 (+) Transcript_5251:258-1067(+)
MPLKKGIVIILSLVGKQKKTVFLIVLFIRIIIAPFILVHVLTHHGEDTLLVALDVLLKAFQSQAFGRNGEGLWLVSLWLSATSIAMMDVVRMLLLLLLPIRMMLLMLVRILLLLLLLIRRRHCLLLTIVKQVAKVLHVRRRHTTAVLLDHGLGISSRLFSKPFHLRRGVPVVTTAVPGKVVLVHHKRQVAIVVVVVFRESNSLSNGSMQGGRLKILFVFFFMELLSASLSSGNGGRKGRRTRQGFVVQCVGRGRVQRIVLLFLLNHVHR